jgi:ribosomal protein L14
MIQKESRLEVADNSGAKVAMVIGIMGVSTAAGRFTRVTMGVGDRVMCAIKEAIPNGQVKAGDKAEAVIVRVKAPPAAPTAATSASTRTRACSSTRKATRRAPASSAPSPASSARRTS